MYQPVNQIRALRRVPASFGSRPTTDRWACDLTAELFSRRWWRGLGTLGLMCATAAAMAPVEPLPAAAPAAGGDGDQWQALAVAPLREGGSTGLAMAETERVEPLASAPERPTVQLFASLGAGDSIGRLLLRSGARFADAGAVAALIAAAAPRGIAPGTSIDLLLGKKDGVSRPVERVALRAAMDLKLVIARESGRLTLRRIPITVDTTPLRVRGRVGDGLYWSLRAAGVTPATAQDYLRALHTQIDVGGDIGRDDRFDLVIANRRAATGEMLTGPLLYAGLDRGSGRDLQLLKWDGQWVEANGAGTQSAGMAWPVHGPITSGFGYRVHPILRFGRMHKGIDFGAGWGAPITAAADGQVTLAGWAGGYGRQVRIAHGGGIGTSYSHMSRMVVAPGQLVRQGQLIGYVGSSGLSTGPHLHYEVYRGGVAVNPLSVRLVTRTPLDGARRDALRARLKALLSVGAGRG